MSLYLVLMRVSFMSAFDILSRQTTEETIKFLIMQSSAHVPESARANTLTAQKIHKRRS